MLNIVSNDSGGLTFNGYGGNKPGKWIGGIRKHKKRDPLRPF